MFNPLLLFPFPVCVYQRPAPSQEGVDLSVMPAEYLEEEAQSDEAAHAYARTKGGVQEEREKTPDASGRFEDITEVD